MSSHRILPLRHLAAGLLLALGLLSLSAHAQQYEPVGDYQIHYSAVSTDFLPAAVAEAHGIQRSPAMALLNVSVLQEVGNELRPVNARSAVRWENSRGRIARRWSSALCAREIRSRRWRYSAFVTTSPCASIWKCATTATGSRPRWASCSVSTSTAEPMPQPIAHLQQFDASPSRGVALPDGRAAFLVRVHGRVSAFVNRCPHQQVPLNLPDGDFLEAGGEAYDYIPALNSSDEHVATLANLIERHIQGWAEPSHQTPAEAEATLRRALRSGAQH